MFSKIKKLIIIGILLISGCVSMPLQEENIPVYSIRGVTYYPLFMLCDSKNISWQYNQVTKVINLTNGEHRVSLKVGDDLVMADQKALLLNYPVEIYEGTVVIPVKFKEEVLDSLFRETTLTYRKPSEFPISKKIRKIVVDAGHGGNDPGAVGKTGLKEKDVNLDIAKRLALLLKSEGVSVILTRSSDRFIPLGERVKIANNAKADLFISIHSNANRKSSMNGFEVYYVATSVNDEKRAIFSAKTTNLNLDNSSFASRSLYLKAMLWDMIYTYDRAESIHLAREICKSADNGLNVKIIGVKDARFEVLRGAQMPAVLIETGFLSNYNEERMLKNGSFRQKMAECIINGVRNYAKDLMLAEASRK